MSTSSFDFEKSFANRNVSAVRSVTKFGRNTAVGTTFVPIALGGVYRTPQVSAATPLRIAAGNVNDTAAGSGARAVTLEYINTSGMRIIETLATAGASPSANTSQAAIRMDRAYVAESGTYATQSAGSHAGDIVIENAAGTQTWATISSLGFPRAQTEIGAFTIAANEVAYITGFQFTQTSNKAANILFFRRENILEASPPYTAMRELFSLSTLNNEIQETFDPYLGVIQGAADVGALVNVASTTSVCEINFNILVFTVS